MTLQTHSFPVLSEAEVARTVEQIYELRPEWTAYQPGRTIFRLGATGNALLPNDEYLAEVSRTRPILQKHFGDLLERVRATLEPALHAIAPEPVVYEERFGLPGFHVLLTDEQNRDPLAVHGGFHCDLAAFGLDWQPPLPDRMPLEHCISFTLALVLPPVGGGLWVCEQVTSREILRYTFQHKCDPIDAMHHLARLHTPVTVPYRLGHMVLHSGQVVHAPVAWETTPGDARITLQGHGFLANGAWRLFW